MSARVREAKSRDERTELVRTLIESFSGWTDDQKFDWLYLDNPWGEACCWVLDVDGDIAGVSSAFPRVVRHRKRELRGWVLGDFCVARQQRSLGPAMKLQRAAFDAVDRGDVDYWYDFPSSSMMAIYQRMGEVAVGELVRMVYLLRADRAVAERVRNPMLAKTLSAAGNTVLATRTALTKRARSFEVSSRTRAFGGTTDVGFDLAHGVALSRTPEYLNWRYSSNPAGPMSILSVADGSDTSIVYRNAEDSVEIVDVFGARDEKALREMILALIDEAKAHDALSITTCLSSEHPWRRVFGDVGFRSRETAPFVVYSREAAIADAAIWYLQSGDRDTY